MLSNIVVPSSYRFWSAEYVYPCPGDNCDDYDWDLYPLDRGPLIYITPHHKIGYKSLGSYVLNNQHDTETGYCGWSSDVSGVPLASSKDDLWGFDINNIGQSVQGLGPCGGSYSGDSAWSATRPLVSMEQGNFPLYDHTGSSQGRGYYFSGLRRIELQDGGSTCGRPFVTLYPEQVWTPLSSKSKWESVTGYCPDIQNPAVASVLVGQSNNSGAPPTDERYWDIDSFQVDNWDSPNLDFPPSFSMWFEQPVSVTKPYQFFGVDLECDIERPVSQDMTEGSAFDCDGCADGVAGSCDLGSNFATIYSDAVINTYTGTEKAGATLDTSRGELCDCWSNPDQGGGCLLFPAFGSQPDESTLVENFEWHSGGNTSTQNGTSSWFLYSDQYGSYWLLEIPTDDGLFYLSPDIRLSGGGIGRKITLSLPVGGSRYIELDSCGGIGVRGDDEDSSDYFIADFPHGQDCDDCNDNSLTAGCCELADGTVQLTENEAACTALGGTYAGDNVLCPPTGCCQISGSSDLSGVTEAYCTTQGGTWTQDVECGTGWCIDNTTGQVTAGIEEDECSGTWSATEPTVGCCDISGTEYPDVAQSWCTSQSGTFTAGDCPTPPLGWCVNDSTGAITANVLEDDCSGTWSATEPTSGCCTISGTNHPDVAQSWCTAQSGTFVAGSCPPSTFDPCGETFQIAVNLVTLDMDDPNFQCNSPFNLSAPNWLRGSADVDKDACSTQGVKAYTIGSSNEVYGDETNDPSALNQIATYLTVKYNSGPGTWTVTMVLSYQYGSTQTITASKSGISGSGFGCPSFTLSGSFDTFSGTYTTTCGGNQKDVNDMIGSFNITLTCE